LNLKMDFYPHLGNHKAKLDKDAELKRKEPGNNAATAGSGPVSWNALTFIFEDLDKDGLDQWLSN